MKKLLLISLLLVGCDTLIDSPEMRYSKLEKAVTKIDTIQLDTIKRIPIGFNATVEPW